MHNNYLLRMGFFLILLLLLGCEPEVAETEVEAESRAEATAETLAEFDHPAWSKDAVIYEVNVRQFSPEGTFDGFEKHLQRLSELGVDILWFMPIHPIGEKERKGELGSYYAVADYSRINPEFGSLEDFQRIVDRAHELGMYVIIDWVPNHTAWDHPWVEEHPDWYEKDEAGNFMPPRGTDWSDVVQLDYTNDELRVEMIRQMQYWVREVDIDGYRCDVASKVPTDFWNDVRPALTAIKPVFMLAEAEVPEHHAEAFDASYGWEFHHLMNQIAQGEESADEINEYLEEEQEAFPADAYRMHFTTNHDENSWNGTVFERMGDAHQTFAVLTFTFPGMPLIYTGQEAALDKRLEFFQRDPVDWGEYRYAEFYQQLTRLKHENRALWNGRFGAPIQILPHDATEEVFAFSRGEGENAVICIFNLSEKPQTVSIDLNDLAGNYTDYFANASGELAAEQSVDLQPWGYRVYTR